ncbi:MAG: BlaI/MecI/CopY family transcriptional regulator [Acidobacteria bacterium]|nr:BlaI/MecI/CopY family transcriptional regulator [Acidobacteriota bacterium]
MKTKPLQPTEAELDVLRILWEHGPSTVRFVHERLRRHKDVGYTTTLKIMQIMTDKGMLERDTRRRQHVYATLYQESETQQMLLDRLLESAFGGSAAKLVMQALDPQRTSPAELRQIRRLLDDMEKERS